MTARRLAQLLAWTSVGLAVVVAVSLAPDVYYMIPWWFRDRAWMVAFLGFVLWLFSVLVRVRPGDDRPPLDERGPGPWWPAWVGPLAVGALAVPLLRHPENLGFGDWDLFLGKYEAARRTVAIWGQFPWWDPWTRGGFPLAANPQCGVWGVAMPLVLAFGTSVGMRLATLVCFGLAVEGARRLAGLWLADRPSAALAGLIYGINGAVLVGSVAAYHIVMCYPVLPWMLYHVYRLGRSRSAGAWLGFWAAFNLLNGIQYFTVYMVLIAGTVWLREARKEVGEGRRRFLLHTVLAAGVFFLLAGWRLATTGLVYRDFPRVYRTLYAETLWSTLVNLLNRPSADFLLYVDGTYFWSATTYIGPVVLVLALLSLRGDWRWWHVLALACGSLGFGSVAWYHPSFWLAHFPVFSTMHDVARWRFMALLGVALAASSVVDAWRRDGRAGRRLLANLAMLAIVADYVAYGYEVLPVAFSVAPTEDKFPGPELPKGEIEQILEWQGFPAILRGRGVVFGFEPLMGYDRNATTARRFVGGPDYRGEHWTARGPARVESWSPNRIVLRVEPLEEVFINQNPGSWWWVNGRPAFEGARCAEKERTFAVHADDQGLVVLEIRPRGFSAGLALHALGGLVALGAWFAAGPSWMLRASTRSSGRTGWRRRSHEP